jgi:hypothetical protein
MGTDITQPFLERATAIAFAATKLGRRLLKIMRGEEARPWSVRKRAPKPPEPEWSELLDVLRDIETVFGLAADPALQIVKEKLKPIGQRVNRCLRLPRYDHEHPIWVWGPEFNTEGLELWQAIEAVPRTEPVLAPWAEEDVPMGQAPVQGNHSTATDGSSDGAAPPIEPPAATPHYGNSQTARTRDDEEFVQFPVKQRKLLKVLLHRDCVPLAEVKKAVYGTLHAATSALERLKTRTNGGLVRHNYALEIRRKSNTYRLEPL